ncbi:glycosyltransferase family 2 protein [Sulfobacillus harzensis]|uniref:Glycosyltransferase n=1 Tax=Sulfobacillus harzensis TaxID=2729629 RepID=A0A7Y0L8B5_9FIRM|nr:glycosyltransferase [Sulfobacillus harzensis]NMP25026.1 glycosyltransferase [Sulfobacillus harzensis]
MASISVVIPAYNAEDTVVDAIRSVLQQSLPAHEIVVVDDGSNDGTAPLVRDQFPSVRLVRVPNGGPSRARNQGIQLVTGEWIAFLDADDTWHPDKLKVQMAQVSPDVELIASDWVRGTEFTSVPNPVPTTRLTYRDMLTMNQFQTSTVLMSTRLAKLLNGFDPEVDGAEDWDFWLRASEHTNIVKVDWPLVQYRDVATGYSKDVWRVYSTMQPMLDKHRGTTVITRAQFATLESWHHLRFWVSFSLQHDREHAKTAWRKAWQPRLRWHALGAIFQYLVPFLAKRLKKRVG